MCYTKHVDARCSHLAIIIKVHGPYMCSTSAIEGEEMEKTLYTTETRCLFSC